MTILTCLISDTEVGTINSFVLGRLGGTVGWASDFSSGHDLTVPEFKPRVS